MPRLLLYASLVCFLLALLVALGASLFGSSWSEWTAGGLISYLLAQVVP